MPADVAGVGSRFCSMLLVAGLAQPPLAAAPRGLVTGMRVAPPSRSARPVHRHDQPSAELPRSWRLPAGWRSVVRELPSGGLVEYLSGQEAHLWARLYSWPAGSAREGAQEARARFGREFDLKAIQGHSEYRGHEFRMTLFSFTDPERAKAEPRQHKSPDVMMKVRATRHEDRLLAAVVGVSKTDDPAARPDAEVDDLMRRLEWQRSPRRAWGQGGL
jgi:hypothetical protein